MSDARKYRLQQRGGPDRGMIAELAGIASR